MGKTKIKSKSVKKILNNIINVTSDEWPRILISWSLQLLYKVAYIVAWITLVAIFTTHYGINGLPYFFIVYAIARIIGVYVYASMLEKYEREKIIISTALLAALMFTLAIILEPLSINFLLFIGIPVLAVFLSQLYILNSAFIEELFTPLESERTFPIVESAETIGGIVGSLALVFLLPILPPQNLLIISVLSLTIMVPIVLFHRKLLKQLPFIQFKPKKKSAFKFDNIKKLTKQFTNLTFLKVLFAIVIAQWIFVNLLEFQFTKAVYANVGSSVGNPAEKLAYGLSTLHIFIFSFALVMQILAASRIISTLGIIGSLLLHPVVTLLSMGAMLFKFGYPAAVLAKLNFEMTTIIYKSAYHTSYYAIKPQVREQIREVLEGFGRPVGTLIGMVILLVLQRLFADGMLNTAISISMITIMFSMIILLLKNENKYSQLSIKNLLHSENPALQLNAVEVLGQKGHKNSAEVLTQTLKQKDLNYKVKAKILYTLGHMREHESILEILDFVGDENKSVQLAALKSLFKFDVVQKRRSKRLFSIYRINDVLKKQFEKETDTDTKALIIKILAKLNNLEIVSFILDLLKSEDKHIKANCIQACEYFDDINLVHYLLPYLESKDSEIKGNTIIALWKYPKYKIQLKQELKRMLLSKDKQDRLKAIYVVGEVEDTNEKNKLKYYLQTDDDEMKLKTAIALAKLSVKDGIPLISEAVLYSEDSKREKIIHEIEFMPEFIKKSIEKNIKQIASGYINGLLSSDDAINLEQLDNSTLLKLRNAYELVNDHEEVQNIDDILYSGNQELQLNPN